MGIRGGTKPERVRAACFSGRLEFGIKKRLEIMSFPPPNGDGSDKMIEQIISIGVIVVDES